jgi:hypothetical protein
LARDTKLHEARIHWAMRQPVIAATVDRADRGGVDEKEPGVIEQFRPGESQARFEAGPLTGVSGFVAGLAGDDPP